MPDFSFPYARINSATGEMDWTEIVIEADTFEEAVELAVTEFYKDESA